MFSSKNKAKAKSKRAPAGPVPQGPRKAPEKPRAMKPGTPVNKEKSPDESDARSATNTSSLNPHLSFEGNLQFSGTVLIDCDFRGTITTDDTLIVGVAGNVEAEVTAGVVEVSGAVHGNIRANSSVKIFSGGEVHGNIETPTISMEEGVVFEGNCTRPGGRPAASATPTASATPAALTSAVPTPKAPSGNDDTSTDGARRKMIVSADELAEMR